MVSSSNSSAYNAAGRISSSSQQRLRLLQITCVEALSEPAVNRSEQFARLLHLALVTPEAREAHCGAEFPGFGLLSTRYFQCMIEMSSALTAFRPCVFKAISPAVRLMSASHQFSLLILSIAIASAIQ